MTESIALFIKFIIDVICIGFCFRTKTFWGSVSAFMLIQKTIDDYNKWIKVLKLQIKDTKDETKIIEFKKEKTKMGFDMSGKA